MMYWVLYDVPGTHLKTKRMRRMKTPSFPLPKGRASRRHRRRCREKRRRRARRVAEGVGTSTSIVYRVRYEQTVTNE